MSKTLSERWFRKLLLYRQYDDSRRDLNLCFTSYVVNYQIVHKCTEWCISPNMSFHTCGFGVISAFQVTAEHKAVIPRYEFNTKNISEAHLCSLHNFTLWPVKRCLCALPPFSLWSDAIKLLGKKKETKLKLPLTRVYQSTGRFKVYDLFCFVPFFVWLMFTQILNFLWLIFNEIHHFHTVERQPF